MAIRELLQEELGNSLKMARDYERASARLPRGCLVKKVIGGRLYYYLASREKDRVRFKYLGRQISEKDVATYDEAKRLRAHYRRLLADVRKQVRFLRKAMDPHAPRHPLCDSRGARRRAAAGFSGPALHLPR